MQKGWAWARFAAAAVLLYPLLRFLEFHAPKKTVRIKVYKDLANNGHAVEHDFILFVKEGRAWAVSRQCTHLGCRLNYKEKEGVLLCPCHQSRFAVNGKRVSGPARKDLPTYGVVKMAEQEGKGYIVTL